MVDDDMSRAVDLSRQTPSTQPCVIPSSLFFPLPAPFAPGVSDLQLYRAHYRTSRGHAKADGEGHRCQNIHPRQRCVAPLRFVPAFLFPLSPPSPFIPRACLTRPWLIFLSLLPLLRVCEGRLAQSHAWSEQGRARRGTSLPHFLITASPRSPSFASCVLTGVYSHVLYLSPSRQFDDLHVHVSGETEEIVRAGGAMLREGGRENGAGGRRPPSPRSRSFSSL